MDTILTRYGEITQTLSNSVTGKTDDNNSSNNETTRFKKSRWMSRTLKTLEY